MNWKDITIKKYLEIHTINEKITDSLEREIHLIACIKDTTYEEIEKMNLKDLTKESASLSWMQELPSSKIPLFFKFKGSRYQATIITQEMTAGQFIDFTTVCNNVKKEELVYQMASLIACMVKRKKLMWKLPFVKYEYEGYDKYNFEDLPMSIAYPYFVFFCNVLTNLLPAMENYSKSIIKKQMKEIKKILKSL